MRPEKETQDIKTWNPGKEQKKATDLTVIVKTWDPGEGELVKPCGYLTHDLVGIETFAPAHPVLSSQLCLTLAIQDEWTAAKP